MEKLGPTAALSCPTPLVLSITTHLHLHNSTAPVSMDSPLLNQLFRQLFNHRTCQATRSTSSLRRLHGTRHDTAPLQYQQSRSFLSRRQTSGTRKSVNDAGMWTKREDYPRDIDQQLRSFPLVTAKDLRNRRERPRQVKMLTREFIEGIILWN